MAGNPVKRRRIDRFNRMGEDAVFNLYLTHNSVRKMLRALDIPEEQLPANIRAFYRWLDDDEGRRARWEHVLEIEGHDAKERIDDVVEDATPETTNLARLKVDHLKWKAESLTKKYGRKAQDMNVTVNVQHAWLGALKEAEQAQQIAEADYEVVTDGDRQRISAGQDDDAQE